MRTYPKKRDIDFIAPFLAALAVDHPKESNRNPLVTRLLPLGVQIIGRRGLERHYVKGVRRSPSRILVNEVPERKWEA